ncbi:outer membrane beta-barrel protein [Longitalea luteola]|uniref:outer membrane beta-barrel protein n=1 Tax=Longitalea luteola TaxID=2812563 RepID=UPI001A96DB29|nr:outer membrane beta-barrel protein [Longitalea luteola]
MKKVLFAAFLLVSSNAIFAQVNKGQWLAGGNISFTSSKHGDNDDSKNTHFEIRPNAGYFFIDKLAGGLRLSYISDKDKGDDEATTAFTLAPFARYYFLDAAQKVNVFADASYGFGSAGAGEKESLNYWEIMAGPAVFLSPNTALELAVGYKSWGGDIYGDDRMNQFGVNIGFQVHLGGKK